MTKLMTPPQRKRFAQGIRHLEYRDVATMLRDCIETGHQDTAAMRILAERAWATAPNDALAEIMLKFHTAFAAGRRIKFGTGKLLSVDGVSVTLIDAVNECFEEDGDA